MHEYLEEQAAHRLTWIVIWLIVAACLVEAVSLSLTSLVRPHLGCILLRCRDNGRSKCRGVRTALMNPGRGSSAYGLPFVTPLNWRFPHRQRVQNAGEWRQKSQRLDHDSQRSRLLPSPQRFSGFWRVVAPHCNIDTFIIDCIIIIPPFFLRSVSDLVTRLPLILQ
jgi:hypothetical protein